MQSAFLFVRHLLAISVLRLPPSGLVEYFLQCNEMLWSEMIRNPPVRQLFYIPVLAQTGLGFYHASAHGLALLSKAFPKAILLRHCQSQSRAQPFSLGFFCTLFLSPL